MELHFGTRKHFLPSIISSKPRHALASFLSPDGGVRFAPINERSHVDLGLVVGMDQR